jgi:hypothetical protein
MRFAAVIDVDLPADVVERAPTFWDACRAALGAKVDRSTGQVRHRIEATTFLHQFRAALGALGIRNARFLVVDGVLVFADDKGQPDDLPELMTAYADHVLLLTESPRTMRLSVEHVEGGLGLELEARISLEHEREEPAARASIIGRVLDLAAGSGESAAAYRARIARLAEDAAYWAALKLEFGAFVSRVEQALGAALPGAALRTGVHHLDMDLGAELPPRSEPAPAAEAARARVTATAARFPEPSRTRPTEATLSPARNFALSVEDRITAAVAGPPPYAIRLRKIEDLHTRLIDDLAVVERESLDAVPVSVVRGLEELNRLIEQHNVCYPIERNLPLDPATGDLLASGEPWKPLAPVSIDDLRRGTATLRRAGSGRA